MSKPVSNIAFDMEADLCIDCLKKTKKRKRCARCKAWVCKSCLDGHPDVLLPHLGFKIKQSVCNRCFNIICSRESNFLIRDREGQIFQSGRVPDGLIKISSETSLIEHDLDESHISIENPCIICDKDAENLTLPNMRIIIILVGSRGDVQPYLGYALKLEEEGHHVRIATHEHHRAFVERFGIEFYPIAGDPAELMEFMVENQLKSIEGFTNKITNHRQWVKDLCTTSWEACTTSLDIGVSYRADVIIANPPSFVGIHLAEKLSIPLIMSFTMPWTATTEFPSPFVRTSGPRKNFLSYMALDRVIWQGIRSIINKWREQELKIAPVRTYNFSGHRLLFDLKIPYIYCFSEKLLPKPKDWGDWIGVSGFFTLDTKRDWDPPEEITNFLEAGEPPVFIGFGSIVVADPEALTNCVFEAIELSGCRAIVQQGWAGIKRKDVPDNVLLIGAAPHDWLFERCSVVVHHGGAGTTATGLRAGKPTVVVPFFGDQFFWGDTISRMELGPDPVLSDSITGKKLADAIIFALQDNIKENARVCGIEMNEEDGIKKGIHLLKKFLPVERMKCKLCPKNVAMIYCENCELRLCHKCNAVVHKNPDYQDHMQKKWKILDWGHRSNWWGSKANAIADGGSTLTANIGDGFVEAVHHVSQAKGIGKVGSVGRGIFSIASKFATGSAEGIATTIKTIQSPSYDSGEAAIRKKDKMLPISSDSISSDDVESEDEREILSAFRAIKDPSKIHQLAIEHQIDKEDYINEGV